MKTELDISNWKRRKHYNFFKDFDNPFYNICTNVIVTELLNYCREKNISFFMASLFLSIKSVNEIEEFRYRIEGDKVFSYNKIHPFSTVLNDDNTFSFCEFNFTESFNEFIEKGREAIEIAISTKNLNSMGNRKDIIYYTTIPWISLTGLTHAHNVNTGDSIPKFVFGKYFEDGNMIKIPFCVEVHHSLVDSYHIGQLLDNFRNNIKNCSNILNC